MNLLDIEANNTTVEELLYLLAVLLRSSYGGLYSPFSCHRHENVRSKPSGARQCVRWAI